jgi:DNA-binding transcriptional LysR family regulator
LSLALARLSKAAATLAMPQSMVSRAVSHLERQCGERLIFRVAARHRRAHLDIDEHLEFRGLSTAPPPRPR